MTLPVAASIRRLVFLAAVACAAWAVVGCDRRDAGTAVVLYVSADDTVARPIIERFERETGLTVRVVGDTEATKTTGLVERLRAERDRPRADVLWSSEVFLTIGLAGEGVFSPLPPEAEQGRPGPMVGRDRTWAGFAQRARVLVFNTRRLGDGSAVGPPPATVHGLLDPRFRGRIVIARPGFGTTRGHLGAMLAAWGETDFRAFFEGLRENGVRLVDGNSAVVRAVAMGEADIGLTDTDDVWAGQRNGWPVDLVYVRHERPGDRPDARLGTMLIPNTVACVSGGPNPAAAARLAMFLLGDSVERMLLASDSKNIPVRPEVVAEAGVAIPANPMTIPFEEVAGAAPRAVGLAEDILRR
ncbi:MAG: substrate-binding domain-containing protein [Phycisphaerales bacterium]|nr:substrate-binding domain-containing protein [Phycisphaerales bacterium]